MDQVQPPDLPITILEPARVEITMENNKKTRVDSYNLFAKNDENQRIEHEREAPKMEIYDEKYKSHKTFQTQ